MPYISNILINSFSVHRISIERIYIYLVKIQSCVRNHRYCRLLQITTNQFDGTKKSEIIQINQDNLYN